MKAIIEKQIQYQEFQISRRHRIDQSVQYTSITFPPADSNAFRAAFARLVASLTLRMPWSVQLTNEMYFGIFDMV